MKILTSKFLKLSKISTKNTNRKYKMEKLRKRERILALLEKATNLMPRKSQGSSKTELNFPKATVYKKTMRRKSTSKTNTNPKNRRRESNISS